VLESKTTEIDGYKYTTTNLKFTASLELLRQLAVVLGPTLSKIGDAFKSADGDVGQLEIGGLGDALGQLAVGLGEGKVRSLIREGLLLTTEVIGEDEKGPKRFALKSEKDFDDWFGARGLTHFGKVLFWAFEVQYGDFFVWARRLAPAAKPALPKA
jgi:hypothetical protein